MYGEQHGTVLSHIFSLFVSIYVLFEVSKNEFTKAEVILLWSQLFVLTNSLIAIFRYGLPDGYKLRKFHVVTLNLCMIGSFSLLEAILYSIANARNGIYVITALNIIPFIRNVSRLTYRSNFQRSDAIIAMNGFFFLWAAIEKDNYHAACVALSYTFGYFFVGDCGYFLDTEVPSIVIYQYMQCFQSLFALYAYTD